MKAGKRHRSGARHVGVRRAAMEPGHEGREECRDVGCEQVGRPAAMEPGHEGREEESTVGEDGGSSAVPQWSPAMKAGKSSRTDRRGGCSPCCRNGARP